MLLLLTDESPSVTSLMDFHLRGYNVGRIAKVWKPHIFDVKTVEGFIYGSVELMTLSTTVSR